MLEAGANEGDAIAEAPVVVEVDRRPSSDRRRAPSRAPSRHSGVRASTAILRTGRRRADVPLDQERAERFRVEL